MKILDMKQRTPEWHELRKHCVTATDFAVIAANSGLCHNMFHKSIDRVIRDKFKKQDITNIYLQNIFEIGHRLEPVIVEYLNLPDVVTGEVVLADDNDNIMCSLDARDSLLECIYEIKTTQSVDVVNKFQYYEYQVIHQMHVTGIKNGCIAIGIYHDDGVLDDVRVHYVSPGVLSRAKWLHMCEDFLIKLGEKS